MLRKKNPASPGFTLLEVMVALLLTGVIFSILFGVYGQTLDVAEGVEQGQRSMRMLRLGTERIRVDLQGVVPPPEQKTEDNSTQEEQVEAPPFLVRDIGDLDSEDPVFMEFCTLNKLEFSDRFPYREGARVSYLLQDGTLVRRQTPFPGLTGEWSAQEVELAVDVRELNVACTGPDGESFSAWPPEGDDILPVPQLLRFSLVLGGDDEPVRRQAFTIRPQWWGGKDETKSAPGK